MRTNSLYLIIGALAVAVVALGIYAWRAEQRPDGVEIKVNEQGISVEGN